MMLSTYLGGIGDLSKGDDISLSIFSEIDDKGEGGVKNLKKFGDSFMAAPNNYIFCYSFHFIYALYPANIISDSEFRIPP